MKIKRTDHVNFNNHYIFKLSIRQKMALYSYNLKSKFKILKVYVSNINFS